MYPQVYVCVHACTHIHTRGKINNKNSTHLWEGFISSPLTRHFKYCSPVPWILFPVSPQAIAPQILLSVEILSQDFQAFLPQRCWEGEGSIPTNKTEGSISDFKLSTLVPADWLREECLTGATASQMFSLGAWLVGPRHCSVSVAYLGGYKKPTLGA